ncbi:MAG: sugar ABC transporter substrate-binding protein [Chloroflexi bacterium]|nr:sugar ABC transporter substrate-binding protein [Chloroflexota bacterium]
MKRLSVLLSLLVIASTLLVSCAPAVPTATPVPAKPAVVEPTKAPAPAPTEAPKPAAKQITLTFYQRGYTEGGNDATSITTAKAIDIFQKANPNVKVNIVGIPWTAEGDTKLEAALAAKTDINLFRVTSPNLPRYAKQGVLSSIEPFLTDEDKKDFYPSGFQVATVDGKIWAWPLWVTAISVFANTDLFKEAGVALPTMDKPWTWDQFVEAAKKLTYKKADGTQIYGFTASSKWGAVEYYPLMYIDGGRILSADGKKFAQTEADGLSALQKIADLALVHKVTPPDFGTVDQATVRAQFKDRKTVAMLMSTPGFVPDLEKENFPLAVIPPPTGKMGKIVTNGAFGLYAVVKVDDQATLKAAHDLAKYLTGSQVAKDIPGWQLAPGLRRTNTGYAINDNRAVIAKLVEYGVYEAPVATSAEIGTRYGAALQAIILGKQTPKQAMDEIAPDYQKELDALSK